MRFEKSSGGTPSLASRRKSVGFAQTSALSPATFRRRMARVPQGAGVELLDPQMDVLERQVVRQRLGRADLARDGSEGATFLHTTFYDGQGMMVRTESGHQTLEDLAGAEALRQASSGGSDLLPDNLQSRDYLPDTPGAFR